MKYAQRNNVVTWVIGDGNGFVDEFCGGGAGDTGDSNYSVEVMLVGVSRWSLATDGQEVSDGQGYKKC